MGHGEYNGLSLAQFSFIWSTLRARVRVRDGSISSFSKQSQYSYWIWAWDINGWCLRTQKDVKALPAASASSFISEQRYEQAVWRSPTRLKPTEPSCAWGDRLDHWRNNGKATCSLPCMFELFSQQVHLHNLLKQRGGCCKVFREGNIQSRVCHANDLFQTTG